MYLIARTKDFEKSLKRIKHSGKFKKQAKDNLTEVINILSSGRKLPEEYKDHQLKGSLRHYRECHIKSNLPRIENVPWLATECISPTRTVWFNAPCEFSSGVYF